MDFRPFVLCLCLSVSLPAAAQIRTPYNSYPPTPEERAQTAELNREAAAEGSWGAGYYPSDERGRDERYGGSGIPSGARPWPPTVQDISAIPNSGFPAPREILGYPDRQYGWRGYYQPSHPSFDDPSDRYSWETGHRCQQRPRQTRAESDSQAYRDGYRHGFLAARQGR